MKQENFSEFLIKKRDSIPLNNSQLAKKAGITSVYLGEIIKKKKCPPDKKTQYALADALQICGEERRKLFDLAAEERNEVPADVYDYLKNHKHLIKELRRRMEKI
nr:hypothetical protein [uncultured Anaeromusa sp.]